MESSTTSSVLNKYNSDHTELQLKYIETQHKLTESRNESAELKHKLARANKEVRKLKDKLLEKIREFIDEVKILKKQNRKLSEENKGLEVEKVKIGEELRDFRVKYEGLKGEKWRLEVEKEKLLEEIKEKEKEREENERVNLMNKKLQREFDALVRNAIDGFRAFDIRVSGLEQLIVTWNQSHLLSSDLQPDATEIIDQEQESFGSEVKFEGLATTESPNNEENATSSPPSPIAVGATSVKALLETSDSKTRLAEATQTPSVSEAPTTKIKLASSMTLAYQSPSTSPFIVELSSSDDDVGGYLASPKRLKRKLPLPEVSVKRENGGSSCKYRLKEQTDLSSPESINHPLAIKPEALFFSDARKTIEALKQNEQRAGVASDCKYNSLVTHYNHDEVGSFKKKWDDEEDLLDDLAKDAELCMKGICALYRQQQYVLYAHRATALGEFLTDGDAEGALKKTLADLEKYDPKGVSDCISIAMANFNQLFKIYKNGKDPFFSPEIFFRSQANHLSTS